jgi:hypothetical protein
MRFISAASESARQFGSILTGFTTVTVILQPGVIVVLGRGYAIWIPCANAVETASEARVRSDASFIIRSNKEERCNGYGIKCKQLEESWAGRCWLQSPCRILYMDLNTVRERRDSFPKFSASGQEDVAGTNTV